MGRRKDEILPYKIFVGNRPWDDFSPEEKDAYANKMVRRMGEAMERYFGQHPEEYAKFQDLREIDPDAEKHVVNPERLRKGKQQCKTMKSPAGAGKEF